MKAFLTDEGLQHIKSHAYVGGEYTWLDSKLNHYWLFVTNLMPIWLAPNLITLIGFVCVQSAFALSWYCSPNFVEDPPTYAIVYGLVASFAYQTLDAVDGKQARRTDSSTPLGQLFDHGCDAFTVVSNHSWGLICCRGGPTFETAACMFLMCFCFWLSQWEEYHLGTLSTSWGQLGVTELQYIGMIQAGMELFFETQMFSTVFGIQVRVFAIGLWLFLASFIVVSMVRKVSTALWASYRAGETSRKGEALDASYLRNAFGMQFLPHLLYIISLFFLYHRPEIMVMAPRSFCMVIGLGMFQNTLVMIFYSMAQQQVGINFPSALCAASLIGATFLPDVWVSPVLSMVALIQGIYTLLWVQTGITSIANFLDIPVFTLKKKTE
jgi:phosphatidylglycerophosphate synthase/multisubunit Na+/H+ antiporter MnhC subunit